MFTIRAWSPETQAGLLLTVKATTSALSGGWWRHLCEIGMGSDISTGAEARRTSDRHRPFLGRSVPLDSRWNFGAAEAFCHWLQSELGPPWQCEVTHPEQDGQVPSA